MGSAFSVRGFLRIGSSASIKGLLATNAGWSHISVMGQVQLGSSLSMRMMCKFNGLSVFNFASMSSSLSIRNKAQAGQKQSVLSFFHLGSALSVRSVGRAGKTLSIFDFLGLGSALSVRQYARVGSGFSIGTATKLERHYIQVQHQRDSFEHTLVYNTSVRTVSNTHSYNTSVTVSHTRHSFAHRLIVHTVCHSRLCYACLLSWRQCGH